VIVICDEFTSVQDVENMEEGMLPLEYEGDEYTKFKCAAVEGQVLYAISICCTTPPTRFIGT
jgi:hypothetical protein